MLQHSKNFAGTIFLTVFFRHGTRCLQTNLMEHLMIRADALAFPFPQANIMRREGLIVDPEAQLDFCQITGVPPFVKTTEAIIAAQTWFSRVMQRPENQHLRCVYGLQHPPEDATEHGIRRLNEAGIRLTTIAYEGENCYGGGFATPEAPLTERGRWLLEQLAENNIALDLSHAGHTTAREALAYRTLRDLPLSIVATHTASYAHFAHLRNLPDDVLVGIRDGGGFVGLVMMTWMLHESDNSETPFFHHLDRLVALLGHEHVGIGSDAVYQKLDPETEARNFAVLDQKVDPHGVFKARYPSVPELFRGPNRLEILEQELRQRGWPENQIRAIVGETVNRLMPR